MLAKGRRLAATARERAVYGRAGWRFRGRGLRCVVISSAFVMRNSMAFFECFSKEKRFPPVNVFVQHAQRSLLLKGAAKRRIDLDGNVIESCHREFDCALDQVRLQSFSPAGVSIRKPG